VSPTDRSAPPEVGGGGGAREAVRTLNPGYFALVMATGIVSIAMQSHQMYAVSVVLLWLVVIEYAVLVGAYTWRLAAFRAAVLADLSDPARAFGYFTFVAATDVLGARLAVDGHHIAALVLLAVGWVAWLALGYVVPWAAVLGRARRPVLQYANGTWFIWVVASQSVAVLAATLEPEVGTGRRELALLAVFSWSVGVFLYAAAGIFVAARLLLYDLRPVQLTPPYRVSMGATAITVVAGARIVDMADAPMVTADACPDRRRLGRLLGLRQLAHPGSCRSRRLAPRRAPRPAEVRGTVVEHRVPARHVRRRRRFPRSGRSAAARRGHRRRRELGGAGRLAADLPGDAASPGPDGPADRYPLARRRWRRA